MASTLCSPNPAVPLEQLRIPLTILAAEAKQNPQISQDYILIHVGHHKKRDKIGHEFLVILVDKGEGPIFLLLERIPSGRKPLHRPKSRQGIFVRVTDDSIVRIPGAMDGGVCYHLSSALCAPYSRLSLFDVIQICSEIYDAAPNYDVVREQCYWFARQFMERLLMKSDKVVDEPGKDFAMSGRLAFYIPIVQRRHTQKSQSSRLLPPKDPQIIAPKGRTCSAPLSFFSIFLSIFCRPMSSPPVKSPSAQPPISASDAQCTEDPAPMDEGIVVPGKSPKSNGTLFDGPRPPVTSLEGGLTRSVVGAWISSPSTRDNPEDLGRLLSQFPDLATHSNNWRDVQVVSIAQDGDHLLKDNDLVARLQLAIGDQETPASSIRIQTRNQLIGLDLAARTTTYTVLVVGSSSDMAASTQLESIYRRIDIVCA